jgi:hypothetical protein
MRSIEERRQQAVKRWANTLTMVDRARRSLDGSRWLIDSSRSVLGRPNRLIRGGNDGAFNFAPLLQLGQSVRHPDHADVGVVIGIIFGRLERALVRWGEGVALEAAETLIEVQQPAV